MKQLALALIAFVLGSLLISGMTGSRMAAVASVGSATRQTSANAFTTAAINATEGALATFVQANPNTPVSSLPTYTQGQSIATPTVNGDTVANGSANAVAANLDQTINQRIVAVTLTIVPGMHQPPITHRLTFAAFTSSPYAALIADTVLSATATQTLGAAPNTAGCNGTGTGCDPNGIQPADPSTYQAALSCQQGVGSGVCPGPTYNDSTYATKSWSDQQ